MFPKIKGIKWLSENNPDLVSIPILLENKIQRDLDIKGLEVETMADRIIIDLAQLCAVRHFYPKGMSGDEFSTTECLAYISGIGDIVLSIPRNNLLEAWIFFKIFRYGNSNRL